MKKAPKLSYAQRQFLRRALHPDGWVAGITNKTARALEARGFVTSHPQPKDKSHWGRDIFKITQAGRDALDPPAGGR